MNVLKSGQCMYVCSTTVATVCSLTPLKKKTAGLIWQHRFNAFHTYINKKESGGLTCHLYVFSSQAQPGSVRPINNSSSELSYLYPVIYWKSTGKQSVLSCWNNAYRKLCWGDGHGDYLIFPVACKLGQGPNNHKTLLWAANCCSLQYLKLLHRNKPTLTSVLFCRGVFDEQQQLAPTTVARVVFDFTSK